MDNHDVPRFLFPSTQAGAPDYQGLHLAMLLLMTEQGIPCIYYGTEQRFSGGNDPANREDMWRSGFETGGETFAWLKRLIHLRKSYEALRRGEQRVVWATSRTGEEADAGIFAFERVAGASYALVVLNSHREHDSSPVFQGVPMTVDQPEGSVLVDVIGGGSYPVGSGGSLTITLAPVTGALLVPEQDVAP
jgi:glycosidase